MSFMQSIERTASPDDKASHFHYGYQIVFVNRGEITFIIGGAEYRAHMGCAVIIGNLRPHSTKIAADGCDRYILNISQRELTDELQGGRLGGIFHASPDACVIDAGDGAQQLAALFSILLGEQGRSDRITRSDAWIVQTILLCLYRAEPERFRISDGEMGAAVQRVRQMISENPADNATLGELAGRLHMSKYHLEHSFTAQVGYSVARYRLLVRLANARELLARTDMSVTEISAEVGIADTSNFSRYFKRETGCSPREYRHRQLH